jgi:hypothetical protein
MAHLPHSMEHVLRRFKRYMQPFWRYSLEE